MKVRELVRMLGADGGIRFMKYLIVIEKTDTGYSAYTPDIQGRVATGATRDEVERTMREAIQLHIEGMTEEGLEIPKPRCYSTYMEAGVSKRSR